MKKLFKTFFCTLILSCAFIACSDDEKPELPPANSAGDKELQAVVSELKDIKEISDFTAVLGNIQLNSTDEKLTIFAVENKVKSKATATQPPADNGINADNIKRHIVAGLHDLNTMTKDTLNLVSVDGSKLQITKKATEILVNGVVLVAGSAEKLSNSIVFKVLDIIPSNEPVLKYTTNIKVLSCTDAFKPEVNPYTPSEGAKVYFYASSDGEKIDAILDSVTTNKDGIAIYKHNSEVLYYSGQNGLNYHNITNDGYHVIGLFANQAEIDSYSEYKSPLREPKPGYKKYEDVNGDGVIDSQDQVAFATIKNSAQLVIYIADLRENSVIEEELDIAKISMDMDNAFSKMTSSIYNLDYLLSTNANYPSLLNVEQRNRDVYRTHYMLISYMHNVLARYENLASKEKEAWNKVKNKHIAQYVYSYLTVLDYYGDVPLITKIILVEEALKIKRSPVAEVVSYLEAFSANVSGDEKYAINQMFARHSLNEKSYAKAKNLAENVIRSTKYSLIALADSTAALQSKNNVEVIFGGYATDSGYISPKGAYAHPVRYTETLLIAAEASFRLGNHAVALQYINELQTRAGKPALQTISIEAIQNVYNREFGNEGQWFTSNAKRWGTLKTLKPESMDYNNLLPLPRSEINTSPSVTQNPGYDVN